MTQHIPFNYLNITEEDQEMVMQALRSNALAGGYGFTQKAQDLLQSLTGVVNLITPSCTASLEMTALLCNIKPGDEVIVPSYSFSSTANAFVLFGATIVFVDSCPKTLNINPDVLEEAITNKTKAIVAMHYAGVACDMDKILTIAKQYNLYVVEDAAQGIMAYYKSQALGTIGDFGTYSFHQSKNIICGEGGSLLINRNEFLERAEIIKDKGTDRLNFIRNHIDKYTWRDIGSSYIVAEHTCALLYAQLQRAQSITDARFKIWQKYFTLTADLEQSGFVTRPHIPEYATHNGHIFYLILSHNIKRTHLLEQLGKKGIAATFHYVPLHQSPAGKKYGRISGCLKQCEHFSAQLIRLPLYYGLKTSHQHYIIETLSSILKH